mgnify:CR=1 FL=1
MPNPYQAFLYPKASLGMILQEQASKHKQGISTYVMKLLLEHFKAEFIEKWSLEEYEGYHKILSMTVIEQKQAKSKAEKQKKAQREKRFRLKERELEIREKNLGIRTDTQTQKNLVHEAECEDLITVAENLKKKLYDLSLKPWQKNNPYKTKWENRLAIIEQKLKEKGCLKPKKEVSQNAIKQDM